MTLNKLLAPVITALLIAFIVGGIHVSIDMGEMKAIQAAMDKRLERIERRIDSQSALGYLDVP